VSTAASRASTVRSTAPTTPASGSQYNGQSGKYPGPTAPVGRRGVDDEVTARLERIKLERIKLEEERIKLEEELLKQRTSLEQQKAQASEETSEADASAELLSILRSPSDPDEYNALEGVSNFNHRCESASGTGVVTSLFSLWAH
jgi:hypothetical protein